MTEKTNQDTPEHTLRRKAEKSIKPPPVPFQETLTPEQVQDILHELRVHQAELEMQNEELQQTLRELETSRTRFIELYDQAPLGYVTINAHGLVIEANHTAETILLKPRSALLYQPFTRFIHPDDQDTYYLKRKQLREPGATLSWDMRLINAAGQAFWAHLQASPSQHDTCRITLEDITKRKRTEELLKNSHDNLELHVAERTAELAHALNQICDSEERHQIASSVAQEAIWEVDFNSGTTRWNRAYHEMFSRPPDQSTHGDWWVQQIHPDERQQVYESFSTAVSGIQNEWSHTYRMRKSDGSFAFIQDRAYIVRDGSGKALRAIGAKLDVSDQIHAQLELARSEKRLHLALDAAKAGMWEWNLRTNENTWSEETWNLYRMDPLTNTATYELWLQTVNPEFRSSVEHVVHEAMRTGAELYVEWLAQDDGSGSKRWLMSRGKPEFTADGDLMNYIGIVMDISELKRTELALIESEERLRFALNSSHIGAWELNLESRAFYHTEELAKIFGYPRIQPHWTFDDFLGHLLPEERSQVTDQIVQAFESGTEWSFEYRIRRADGQICWIWTAGQKLINTPGSALRAAGIVRDITRRKEVEAELLNFNNELEILVSRRTAELQKLNKRLLDEIDERQRIEKALMLSNEEWLNTFNASIDPIMVLDCSCRIRRVNKAMAALLGMPVEECAGKYYHQYLQYSTEPPPACPNNQMLQNRQPHTEEIYEKTLGKHLLVTVSPLFESTGILTGSMHYIKDITTLKQAEQVLANAKNDLEQKVAERTAELDLALDQMKKVSFELVWAEEKERERIAGELHDQVGQSLLLAKLKLDALESELPDGLHRKSAFEVLSLLENSIRDIRSLTFRMRPPILDTSGIEISLEWLCSSVYSDYHLKVDFSKAPDSPQLATEVRYSLYQAVRELLLNVVKHSGTKQASMSLTTDNRLLIVRVADNGVGFSNPSAILKHINNGGFGLFNVKQRIEQMGGSFSIDSGLGRGTTVTLTVPLTETV